MTTPMTIAKATLHVTYTSSFLTAPCLLSVGIHEINVYGVEIPGADGRACMAAIVKDDTFSLEGSTQIAVLLEFWQQW